MRATSASQVGRSSITPATVPEGSDLETARHEEADIDRVIPCQVRAARDLDVRIPRHDEVEPHFATGEAVDRVRAILRGQFEASPAPFPARGPPDDHRRRGH